MLRARITAAIMTAMILISSCKKEDAAENQTPEAEKDFRTIVVPDNFDYATTDVQPLDVEVLLLGNVPYEGARFEVYLENPEAALDDPSLLQSLKMISSFRLDDKGKYSSEIKIPSYVQKVYLLSKSIAIPGYFEVSKGANGFVLKYNAGAAASNRQSTASLKSVKSTLGAGYFTSATRSWSNVGFPDYLIANAEVSARFLQRFESAVPKGVRVKEEYLNNPITNIVLDLKESQTATVDITFLFANSRNLNTLGYYWYPTSNPPATQSAITNRGYVFPNTSRQGVAGASNLQAGHTVKLIGPNADGSFPPNTTIGFFIIPSGFTASSTVGTPGTINTGRTTYYSNTNLNAFGSGAMATIKQRMITFYDEPTNKIVWSFEDQTDGDFSDVAFFASWTPDEAIKKHEFPKLPEVPKTDADYVFYPAKNTKGTLLFEDCWPRLADFDMNDMILNHNYVGELDEYGKVGEINFSYDLASISAQQNNSFGVMIPGVDPANVESVSNLNLDGVDVNSTSGRNYAIEGGHTNDVVVKVFDQASNILGGKVINNVGDGAVTRASEKFSFTVKFKEGVPVARFNAISPFIIPRGNRTVETHLSNKRPSAKANTQLFGTDDDNTSVGSGRYYLSNTRNSAGNLTWAVDVPEKIPYPKSGMSMTGAFRNFVEWATSGGVNKANWYSTGSDNRNDASLVYPTN